MSALNTRTDAQIMRLSCGLTDANRALGFTFNGKNFTGLAGDTLASALVANGQKLVGRSFKYHRPRGVYSAGPEEPNALVELRDGPQREPNTRATVTELYQGLQANSQNHRGSLKFDLLGINDYLWRFLSAGFYYKTFMWPKAFWEKVYEPIIRASAGLGKLSLEPDPDLYDKGFLHCDVLIIGSGAAGLSAALTAARAGARVILAEQDFLLGGRLNAETYQVNGIPGNQWARETVQELTSLDNVRIMPRTTIYGCFDHGVFGALERVTDHIKEAPAVPRQILWRIYAKTSILCAGSTERLIAFANNDLPGIMLAGSARTYINRFGAAPGVNLVVATNNDDGWRTAIDAAGQGLSIAAIVDSRPEVSPTLKPPADTQVFLGTHIASAASSKMSLSSVGLSNGTQIKTDCLAVSGGWNPDLHLTCHQGAKPVWDNLISAFVPSAKLPPGMQVAGASAGSLTLDTALAEGYGVAQRIVSDLGLKPTKAERPRGEDELSDISPLWKVSASGKRAWVDLQNDVTTKDIDQASAEGFNSIEHLKRYTTMGMATDQGKIGNVVGLGVLAETLGKPIQEVGTTTFRPPYTPVAIGALAGRAAGRNFRPTRLTPTHAWAKAQGAVFVEVGNWLRAQWFPLEGETHWRESVDREVLATRKSVGVCDVTTLGKIDVKGKDATEFLNRIYANGFAKLAVGRTRYGIMLREDGIVYDDGTAARLSENHYVVTTTTANAVTVFRNMEFARQCLWPNLDVHLISTTDAAAQFAIAGPNSRALLSKIVDHTHDISNEAFPFMACGKVTICNGFPARLFRISFSGELAYELSVPTRYGDSLIRTLMTAGKEFDVIPYGTEALGVMRIEKGHAAGNELNGQTSADELGLGKLVSTKKDCIGNTLSLRHQLTRKDGRRLVGFIPEKTIDTFNAGAHLFDPDSSPSTETDLGWITSVAYSPTLGHTIGLGFVQRGAERMGEVLLARDSVRNRNTRVTVVSPHFVDPNGERLRA